MKKIALALLLGSVFVVGCGDKAADGKDAKSASASGSSAAKKDDKAAGGDEIGVKECDEYIKTWKDCYKDPAAKAAAQPGLDAMVKAWKDAAAQGGAAKDALGAGCKQALDSFPKAACK
ncbi:MAG TPA: hypothetical protein VL400_16740 [Polyangiaceae bacterium]|nr:hypothetical protein [Polyangiaceae bacterium]